MTRVVTTSGDGTARIWDAVTGEQLVVLPIHDFVFAGWASFSPDGTRIVNASWNSYAGIFDATTGERIAGVDRKDDYDRYRQVHGGLFAEDDHVQPALFSPDGTRIVTASVYQTARIFDAATGESLAVFRHESHVRSASFSPDGTHIVTASSDKTARIWDAATGDQLFVLGGHEKGVNSASFSPDGTRIVTTSDDRTVRTWDAVTGKPLAIYRGHENPMYWASFTPDGTRIVSASDHAAHIWDATADDQLPVIRTVKIPVSSWGWQGIESVSFSPDGTRIMTNSSYGKRVRIWDAATGEQLAVLAVETYPVIWASLSPDGTRIVTASWRNTARMWDAATGEHVASLRGRGNRGPASFSPDGMQIVTASSKTARIWDATTGEQRVVLKGHEERVKSASFSPDGTWIVTASCDNTARIWDAATGEQLAVLGGHHDSVHSASFSPDGTRIVTASADNTARIWDASAGDQLTVLRGHEDWVGSASFSPDGTRVVTASRDNTARIWDVATGEQLIVLRGHEVAVFAASFSPDGTRIVSGHDTTIRIWDSVPHAQRYRQKQALKDAEPKAARLLDVFFATASRRDGAPDLRAVVESIRTDSALDEAVRHVAINLLMRRVEQIQSKANDVFDDVKTHFVFAADIQTAVQAAPSLEPAVRAAAIRIARLIEDTPGRLSRRARRIVNDDDRTPMDYERAQRAAASAFQSDPTDRYCASTLAKAWTRLHQPEKVVEVWREHVEKVRKDSLAVDWRLAKAANALIEHGMAFLKNDQAKGAEPVLRECLSIREEVLKKDDWLIANARSNLGESLAKQAKFIEAEPLVTESANALQANEQTPESRKNEAIQRVVDLYEAWHAAEPGKGYDAKSGEWRAKLSTAAGE
jgi:WD40 repeat protein